MKLMALACGAVLVLAQTSFAQDEVKEERKERGPRAERGGERGERGPRGPGGPGGDPEQRLERLAKSLDLTDEQRAQIKTITAEAHPAGKAIREDDSLSREARGEKMRAHRDEVDAKINAVLTPEQQTKFAEIKARQKERMRDRGPRGDKKGEQVAP